METTDNNDTMNKSINRQNVGNISFNEINYLTLEIMANTDSYCRYLKKNNLEYDSILKKEQRFYRKRIISMTKDILFNKHTADISGGDGATDQTPLVANTSAKIDDVILNAFNTFARACISYFKFKDTMDTIQGDYVNMDDGGNQGDDNDDTIDDLDMNETNKLFMRQMDKKVLTLDNYVIKTAPPPEEMIIPHTKDFNLKDPKYKKKDIKNFSKKPSVNNPIYDNANVIISKKSKSDIELLLENTQNTQNDTTNT